MNTTKNTIAILGCGWLGLPLAAALIKKGFHVIGTTSRPERLPLLENEGIEAVLYRTDIENVNALDRLCAASQIIITIPPLRNNPQFEYAKIVELWVSYFENRCERLVFTSSISVYGESTRKVDETSLLLPATPVGQQLVAAEQAVLQAKGTEGVVLRLGGLIGPDRHPITHLSGRHAVPNPNAPINLVHQLDLIAAISLLMERPLGSLPRQVYNLVSPQHPSRETYYTQQAQQRNLPAPIFDHSQPAVGKTVLGEAFSTDFGFEYKNV
ncbi:MAG: NAD(P)-dependent oxidoreductase [Flavobacterium sp. BFFFF2]|nr:MAG: NAD(P)-dependent oxidoreductase [Flavobacterium sp. BFFFF2]